jgi:hypothetical protein
MRVFCLGSRATLFLLVATLVSGCSDPKKFFFPWWPSSGGGGGGPHVDKAASTVLVDPASGVTADGSDRAVITITVANKKGKPLRGVKVRIKASGAGNIIGQPPEKTDENGLAEGTIASTVAGTKTITVIAGEKELVDHPEVTFVAASPVVAASVACAGAGAGPAVVLLPDGGIVAAGPFSGETVFGDGEANETALCAEGVDVYVARWNADGTLAWAAGTGGPGDDLPGSIALSAVGTIEVRAIFGGEGGADQVIARYDGEGDLLSIVAPHASSSPAP